MNARLVLGRSISLASLCVLLAACFGGSGGSGSEGSGNADGAAGFLGNSSNDGGSGGDDNAVGGGVPVAGASAGFASAGEGGFGGAGEGGVGAAGAGIGGVSGAGEGGAGEGGVGAAGAGIGGVSGAGEGGAGEAGFGVPTSGVGGDQGGTGGTGMIGSYDAVYDCTQTIACLFGEVSSADLDACVQATLDEFVGLPPEVLDILEMIFAGCSSLSGCDYIDCVEQSAMSF